MALAPLPTRAGVPRDPTAPLRARVPGAVSAGSTTLGGRPVVLFRVDPTRRRGALGAADGDTIAAAAALARRRRVPLIGVISSSGADVREGVAALHGWGGAAREMVACSGVVPIVLVVTGPALSGPALLLGLADVVVMTEGAFAYMSGPRTVASVTGEKLDSAALGGAAVHARETGVAALVAPDEEAALAIAGELLAFVPAHADEEPPLLATADPPDRPTPEAAGFLPDSAAGSYDVRQAIGAVVDDGDLLELRAAWAPNLVTGLASVGGRPVGVVANQPMALAGTLDIAASQKGARFVQFCDAFNLPLLTFVDCPGFFPGQDLEWRGMIRHGAQLAYAYAQATVPRVAVILRKAYGGAYIVMDSRSMGNDLCLAWPSAEVAVMGARGAVQILHRGAAPEEVSRLAAGYEEAYLTPWVAAERGYVDAVIDPADTRLLVSRALDMLAAKREDLVPRKHGNAPL